MLDNYPLHEKIVQLEATITKLEDELDYKEPPDAEVYELRKACGIYKVIIAEQVKEIRELKKQLKIVGAGE